MPVTTSYPGVYIEELTSPSLSIINTRTAVPAIAVASGHAVFKETTKIYSWLEFLNYFKDGFSRTDVLQAAVRAYFENGGSLCYLVPVGVLVEEVPKLDDVTLLVAAGQNIKSAVNELCQSGKTLFALYDGPEEELTTTVKDHGYSASPYAAIYYPWLNAEWTDKTIPPSAAVAGAYCRSDLERGVWKAPANIPLLSTTPVYKVTDDIQGVYNTGRAINMIRSFPKTGNTIWGARTLDDTDDWRYVSVRRLFNMAEKDIKKSMEAAVFEPNNQPTWEKVRAAIQNYLYGIWRQGGLAGTKEEEAYFVQIGKDITMTETDINQGKMIVKIGIAAVRPAEFIILQFSQKIGNLS